MSGAQLEVVRATGLVTIQDLGRRGHMHEAVPPGGALVPELLIAANRGADNPDGAPGLEIFGQLVVRARSDLRVAIDDTGAHPLRAGEELVVASGARRCAYLAVRGGLSAPLVLGGRGTLLCAGLGSPLRTGASLSIGTERDVHAAIDRFIESDTITIIPGPDRDAFTEDALDILTHAPYRIAPSSDRVGTRLVGAAVPRVPGYRDRSRPMVRGALEVPADGQPIALGPEHPTTGGYPVIAVIATAELGRCFAIRPGGFVRFTRRLTSLQ